MSAGSTGCQVTVQLLHPVTGLNHGFFQSPDICLAACNIRSQTGLLAPQFQILFRNSLGIGGHGSQLLLQLIQILALLFQGFFNNGNSFPGLIDLIYNTAAAVFLTLEFFFDPCNVGMVIFQIALDHSHLAFQLLMVGREHVGFQTNGFQFSIPAAEGFTQLFCLPVQAVQIIMGLLQHKGGRGIVLFCLLGCRGQLVQGIQPDSYLNALQFLFQPQVGLGFFGLLLQRFQLQFQFGNLIADTQQIVLGMSQFALCFFLAVPILGDTGSFFKNFPAVCTFQRKNLINASLADIAVAFPTQAGIHKHLMDIPQAGRLLIDVKFTVTAAVEPAGNHNLVRIIGKRPVGIVQGQGCFRKTHGTSLLGTAEDHIFHLGTAKGLGTLLAHNPENRIGNVGFTGAVGAHNGSDIIAEADQCFVRKGLKTL